MALAPPTGANAAMTPTGEGSGHGQWNGGHVSGVGNGKFNKNDLSVNSPSFVNGNQHVFNQNVGGQAATQNVICKWRHTRCKINQRMIVRDP
ncbi:hypothetical protein [Actinoallomurus sp. CA-142502]|uniref:hypothetical protein n=1 Tax=Actinoallomurus sp. CA-142502 TaxID=3239885 RepID=UPI003D90C29C